MIPSSWHAIIGSFTSILIGLQLVMGHVKVYNREKKSIKWHGKMGLVSYVCVFVTIALGTIKTFIGVDSILFTILFCIGMGYTLMMMLRLCPTTGSYRAVKTSAEADLAEISNAVSDSLSVA